MSQSEKINVFEHVDLFGKNFNLTFSGKQKFRTSIGGYTTVVTVLLLSYVVWILGNEIVFKNMPKDYQVIELTPEPRNISLFIPFGLMIKDNRGNIIEDYSKYLNFNATYYNLVRKEGKFINYEPPENVSLRACKESDFSEETVGDFRTMQVSNALCIDNRNLTLGGDFTLNFSKFVSIVVTPCYNTTIKKSCPPKEEVFAFLNQKRLVISVKVERLLYDSRDHSNPIKKIIGEDNILIDPFIFNFPRYEISKFVVDTDNGLIGSSNSQEVHYETSFLNDIITAFDNEGKIFEDFKKLILFESTIFESAVVKTQFRSDLKITEMLASLGGILKVYLMVVGFLFHEVYDRMMYEKVINKMFSFEEWQSQPAQHATNIIKSLKNKESQNINYNFVKNPLQETSVDKLYADKLNIKSKIKNKNDIQTEVNKQSEIKLITKENKEVIEKKIYHQVSRLVYKDYKLYNSCDHIVLALFSNLTSKCSDRLKYKNQKFNKLFKHMTDYIDVLSIINHFSNLENMKFVMFNRI